MEVIDYYRTCFQREFCYCDGKRFAGLTDCQSRDLNKLHFHFNASFVSINLAKVKVLCHNIFFMQRFISMLGIKPNEELNRKLWEEGIKFCSDCGINMNEMFNELLI